MWSANIKRFVFFLVYTCIITIVISRLLQWKPYRPYTEGMAASKRLKKESSIARTVTTSMDMMSYGDNYQTEPDISATNAAQLDFVGESVSRDKVLEELAESAVADLKDVSVDTEGDNSATDSRKLQEVVKDVEENDGNGDFNAESGDDKDNDEYERLKSSPYIYNVEEQMKSKSLSPVVQGPVKYISYFPQSDTPQGDSKRFSLCEYNKCDWVNNISEADALVFRGTQLMRQVLPQFHRPAGQLWIWYTVDPSAKWFDLDRPDIKSSFNLTMTYQSHSDIPMTYGRLQRRKPPAKDYEKLYDAKTKGIAWFVSHCETWSKREDYVDKMRKVVHVDIFGACSNLTCGQRRHSDSSLCLPMLTTSYKFYLAFENAFCKEYITEKFFKLFQDIDVIPVVRGGFDYKNLLPSGIFVDASDFKSPEALGKYLIWLGNNKKEYVKMLIRKNSWTASPFVEVLDRHKHCGICRYLHTADNKRHVIENLVEKFHGKTSYCWEPTDI